ncbi:MAG: radical SAM/SPASM domain-containing protein [Acutalibacteraceae bacterium]
MKYFQLNPECYLITGVHRSLIHNLITGRILWLDVDNTKQILLAESGNKVNENEPTFKELEKLGWGFFSDSKYFVDKLRSTNIYNETKIWKNSPNLFFATIQLTTKCNSKCSFCNNIFCPICIKDSSEIMMDKSVFFKLINECVFYGLKEVLLTGGEPLLHPNIHEICSYMGDKNISLSIKTSGLIKPTNFPPNTKFIILLDNFDDFDKIVSNYKNYRNVTILTNNRNNFALSRLPEGWSLQFFTKNLVINKETMMGTTLDEFFLKKLNNPCLFSKITVLSDGSVVPCLQNKNRIIGNVKNDEFAQIIKNLSLNYWSKPISERKFGKCKSCEFKYACNSCVFADCDKSCSYDVEAGQWK